MADQEKAIKAGKSLYDSMRFDNIDEQIEVIKALKNYRKGKVKGKDLTLEERIILLEIRTRSIEPLTEIVKGMRKELFLICFVLTLFCICIVIIFNKLSGK